jgi:endogenous inhibitor of DNA gyrase (YacG/DUF329 family)
VAPFCSKACAEVDLARWLGGDYRIETGIEIGGAAEPDALPGAGDAIELDRIGSSRRPPKIDRSK